MASTDFPNGLASVNEYLDTRHHTNTDIQGQIGDNAKVVVKSEYDFSLREIICNLLAGRGIKLPNIQVCLSVNLKAILGVPGIQAELLDALNELDSEFDKFMTHTGIEETLGRVNSALAEVTQIANMINFCATPIEPIAIPNILEQTMDSFLGAGKDIINAIGNMVPDQVGGCLGFNGQEFNLNLFNGGILGDITSQWDNIKSGQLTQNQLNGLVASINSVKDDLKSLMDRENSVVGTEGELGGSMFSNDVSTTTNTEMGLMHNAGAAGIQGNTRLASQLKAQYDRLAGYPVVDKNGKVYKNIFELILEPGLLALLDSLQDPSPEISERQPVFSYCGEIVGYTASVTQDDPDNSSGYVPATTTPEGESVDITSYPGYNAGGINTTGSNGSGAGGSSTTIINSTTVSGGTVKIVGSLSAQLALASSLSEGDIVVRSDINVAYSRNSNAVTNTITDYTAMATPVGNYLQDLDANAGSGIVVKDGLLSQTRKLTTTSNQLQILNDTGQGGDINISISENPVIPGTAAIQVPRGTTAQRPNTEPGEFRYNTTNDVYEGYFGGSSAGWRAFNTGGSSVNNASNIGGGVGIFLQNNVGNLEFKTLLQSASIQLTDNGNAITISENITASNVGTGQSTFKQRNGNDFEFKRIDANNNISVSTVGDTITISGDQNVKYTTTSTSTSAQTEVLFSGARLGPPADTSWFFTITAIGKVIGGVGSMAIKREGVVDNSSGAISIVSDDSASTKYNNNVGSAWDLIIDDSSNDFRMYVVGANATNINWTVKVELIAAS
jgi:hypothetical protein